METVVYILGAGASAGIANSRLGYIDKSTIPLVSELVGRMNSQAETMESMFRARELEVIEGTTLNIKKLLDPYVSNLKKVAEIIKFHASFDTYARKEYLLTPQGDTLEVKLFKRILSTFFCIEQIINGVDIRYDSLFATILKVQNNHLTSPDNFKFFSWNYDYQFELAHSLFFVPDETTFETYIKQNQLNTISDPNKFFYLKLNGSAINICHRNKLDAGSILMYNQYREILNDDTAIIQLLQIELEGLTNPSLTRTSLKFSWERDEHIINSINSTKLGLNNCKSLVVIGYSYPIFNTKIDTAILAAIPSLKNIYFQIPKQNFEDIKHRFIRSASKVFNIDHLTIRNIESLDSFYIPNEIDI